MYFFYYNIILTAIVLFVSDLSLGLCSISLHNLKFRRIRLKNAANSGDMVMVVVFNATFNNISAISWRSVLLVKETVVPGENPKPAAIHCSYNVVSSTLRHERDSNSQR